MTARSRNGELLIVAAGVIAAGIHIYTFRLFYSDDALISLRYAQRLLDGQGLTWTDGPRVEGYSNLLWTLGCAALGFLGVDLITATRVLGALGTGAVLAALWYYRATARVGSAIPFAAGVAAVALAGPMAAWAWAGLETPLVAALLAWGFVLLIRSMDARAGHTLITASGICFGLLNLTRPDGPLFTMIAAIWLALAPGARPGKRKLVAFLAWPAALFAAQLAFRLLYYGEWLPNVWYVKISPSVTHLVSGLKYVGRGLLGLMPASALSIVGLVIVIRRDALRRAPAVLLLASMIAWLGYVAFIGGDIFSGRRHMVPFVIMMALGLMLALEWGVSVRRHRAWAGVAALGIGLFVGAQLLDGSYRKVRKDLWVRNTEVVGRVFGDAFGESRPLLAICAAGGIPYWSQLPCLDMLGLNDRVIARAKSPGMGENWIGHERADANYVMSRRPDLIHFGAAAGGSPTPPYKDQMAKIPAFWIDYIPCRIGGWRPHTFITSVFVDRASPRLGIQTTPDRIDVPTYFIEGSAAMWNEGEHRFVVSLQPRRQVGVRELNIDAGRWQIALPEGIEAQLVDSNNGTVIATAITSSTVIDLDAPVTANVVMRTQGGRSVYLYSLVLARR